MRVENMKKKRTLQFQITLTMGILLVVVCAVLTVNSIYSASRNYGELVYMMEGMPAQSAQVDPDTYSVDTVTFADAMHNFSTQGLTVMAGVIVVALVFTYWLTGRFIKPLGELTGAICKIDEENLHERVVVKTSTREVEALSGSFNSMLDRLEASFKIQKRFAANAAHELKTPLAVIKSSLQVLELDEQPALEDYKEFTNDTRQCLDQLIKTVDSLLFLANEHVDGSDGTIHLKDMLIQVVSALRTKALAGNVAVSVSGGDAVIQGNPTLIYRVFYNIVENAIKYNHKSGYVHIQLTLQGERPLVTVADNGHGMSPETVENIYEPFYRADKSRSQEIEGSGLGMSIVRTIIERYGAQIEIDSREDEGTTVKILF